MVIYLTIIVFGDVLLVVPFHQRHGIVDQLFSFRASGFGMGEMPISVDPLLGADF